MRQGGTGGRRIGKEEGIKVRKTGKTEGDKDRHKDSKR